MTITMNKIMTGIDYGRKIINTYELGMQYYRKYQERQSMREIHWVLSVDEADQTFSWVHGLMLDASDPVGDRQILNAHADTRDGEFSVRYDSEEQAIRTATIDGHPIEWSIGTGGAVPAGPNTPALAEDPFLGNGGGGGKGKYTPPSALHIFARSLDGRRAVQKAIEDMLHAVTVRQNPPVLATWTGYGWSYSRVRLRSIESVVLEQSIKDAVIADVEKFLESEDRYIDLGLPWHHGILFHGPPGTGKTSLVRGIAAEFNLNVYTLSLASIESDDELGSRIAKLGERSILLLEDIDAVNAAVDRDGKDEKGVTTSGLLNILDGLNSPHGCLAIMTTNHPDKLDPAIMRPGRVDLSIQLGYATAWQADTLYKAFYNTEPSNSFGITVDDQLTTAAIIEVFKMYLDDPEDAEAELHSRINTKRTNAMRLELLGAAGAPA